MKLAVFSTKPYDRQYLDAVRRDIHTSIDITYHDVPLNNDTKSLTHGMQAVCVFVNDTLDALVIEELARNGAKAILLRCAGFNNVDLEAAQKYSIMVANVPSYSPEAVAEYAVALLQTLNRNTHRAYNRAREGNFALQGLMGRTLHDKTVGILGTGKIGTAAARILKGYGCRLLAFDLYPSKAFSEIGEYTDLERLFGESHIITLHCPLTPETHHIINDESISKMKPGVMVVNTSRGGLVDTQAAIRGLKNKQIGGLTLDVYEGEGSLFYNDHSGEIIHDDLLMRLMTFHNVIVSGHQAFFTEEALGEIAQTTLRNLTDIMDQGTCQNALTHIDSDVAPVRAV